MKQKRTKTNCNKHLNEGMVQTRQAPDSEQHSHLLFLHGGGFGALVHHVHVFAAVLRHSNTADIILAPMSANILD